MDTKLGMYMAAAAIGCAVSCAWAQFPSPEGGGKREGSAAAKSAAPSQKDGSAGKQKDASSPAPSAAPVAPAAPSSGSSSQPVAAAQAPTPPATPPAAPKPARDPTLIEVPTNTLGPGEPLWVRSDRQSADARIAIANAQIAEREAARPYYYDNYFDGSFGPVVYGPHAPGWAVRNWFRPGLGVTPHRVGNIKPTHRPGELVSTIEPTDDVFDRAQIHFGRIAYPKIAGPIEGQLEAQRRFSEVARPPIVRIQNQIDQAQLRMRKGTPR